jgi:hypothetical protein
MLGAELGAVDGSLLGDEFSDGAVLGSPLGIKERLGLTEGSLALDGILVLILGAALG